MKKNITAIGLISGGLDSALAIRLVQEQGIEVIGVSCRHPFHPAPPPGQLPYPERLARQLGIELIRPDVTEEMLEIVSAPSHGWGKHLNPCIDCRMLYLRHGARIMRERGARFLITGEVLGQRPMSQRRDALNIIDRDSGLRGLILRPLSARLLPETVPELEGWVDREKLLGLSGRSRQEQLRLAEKFGISEFSPPAGGCLLTMEGFAARVEDILQHSPPLRREEVELLKIGRHFRLSEKVKLVAGRNENENHSLEALARPHDLLLTCVERPGPLGLLRGPADETELRTAAAIIARYADQAAELVRIRLRKKEDEHSHEITVPPLERHHLEEFRI